MLVKNSSFTFRLVNVLILLTLLLSTLGVTPAHAAGIHYAKPTATGTGDCSSWANACTLQTALAGAVSGDEIWVAAGTHKPTTGADRSATFQLKDGVAVYGGFAGTETARDQHNPTANLTILSGDIDNNDSQIPVITSIDTVTGNTTNSYHVVTGANDATLDGFTITAGSANLGDYNSCPGTACGGGMFLWANSPTVSNVIFSGNTAIFGGGIASDSSSSTLTNVTFSGNFATYIGGGLFNQYGSPSLTNVTFSGNSSWYSGGGMYSNDGSPTLTNVTFKGNSTAGYGGGMCNDGGAPQIRNAIFWDNTAPYPYQGAQIYDFYTDAPLRISDSVVQGGYAGGAHIITDNPMLGVLGDHGGFTQTIPLQEGSSAINTANDAFCPATDQRGVSRPQSTHCDIGAYEYDALLNTDIYYVEPVASGTGDCLSWVNACTLQTALNNAAIGNEIWVAAGTHKPTTVIDLWATFQLKNGVAVYGGFSGTETARDQRDFVANVTILSGDLNIANVFHVVTGVSGAVLDGFTITGGNASFSGFFPHDRGGGMYNEGSSPVLANLIFSANSAQYGGGGMYNYNSGPMLTDVTFSDNSAPLGGGIYNDTNGNPTLTNAIFTRNTTVDYGYGGGMYNATNTRPMLMNVSFSNNSASEGGGIYNLQSSPMLMGVSFSGNSANETGGGMHNYESTPKLTGITFIGNSAKNGGGMHNFYSRPVLTNVTFKANLATGANGVGGGMHNYFSNPVLTNVTFSANSATAVDGAGGGMYNFGDRPQIQNTIFWGNTAPSGPQIQNDNSSPVVSDSIVQGGYVGGTNIITADPMLGTLGDYGGFTQVIPLLAGSSAIDAGDDTVCPDADQRGMARPQGTHCDIGAYEYGETQTFNDVPVTHWAWDYIERLYAANITGGCGSSPRIYCPEKPVTRAQMAIFIERGMNGSAFTPPPASGSVFGDVAASYWAAAWIEQLAADNITGGCGAGNYCPDNPVTRAQMAVFLLKAMHGSSYLPPAVGDNSGFADVPNSYWAAAWIKQLAAEGITGGCGAGNYCPDRPVTRAQMAVFLVKAFGLP